MGTGPLILIWINCLSPRPISYLITTLSSFSLGSVSKLSLLSLNHDLLAVLDIHALDLRLAAEFLAVQRVPLTTLNSRH